MLLKREGIPAKVIDAKMPAFRRQKLLTEWGRTFYPLLSVHTLEIGYDVPEVGIEIILATTSNMNQIVQRVGRVLRKVEGKESALVYLIHASDTKHELTLTHVKSAINRTVQALLTLLHSVTCLSMFPCLIHSFWTPDCLHALSAKVRSDISGLCSAIVTVDLLFIRCPQDFFGPRFTFAYRFLDSPD
jgi:hypothetical protein